MDEETERKLNLVLGEALSSSALLAALLREFVNTGALAHQQAVEVIEQALQALEEQQVAVPSIAAAIASARQSLQQLRSRY